VKLEGKLVVNKKKVCTVSRQKREKRTTAKQTEEREAEAEEQEEERDEGASWSEWSEMCWFDVDNDEKDWRPAGQGVDG